MRRLVALLIGLAFLVVPAQALAALAITSPLPSATYHSDESLTVSWNADGDSAANNVHTSYLLFTGASWSVTINLSDTAIAAHTIVFKPSDTVVAFRAANPNVTSVTSTPLPSSRMLPADTYAIDLFILNTSGNTAARASTVLLSIVDQCAAGSYSADGWPSCTQTTRGHYASTPGSTVQLPCQPGTFAATVGNSTCFGVPPGTYAPESGAETPTDCAVGTYQDEPGQIRCKTPPAGTFVAVAGALSTTPCPQGTTSPAGSVSATACVGSETGQRTDAGSAASTKITPACVVARGTFVTGACVAGQLGVSIAKPITVRLALPRGSQTACVVRHNRIRGVKAGSCRVVVVVVKPGTKPKTYRATVTIGA